MNKVTTYAVGVVATIVVVLLALWSTTMSVPDAAAEPSESPSSTPSVSPSASAEPELCSTTWVIEELDSKQNRLFFEGLASIKNAKTNEEAAAAAYDWLEAIKVDPDYLVAATKVVLSQDVERSTLITDEGCASDEAYQLYLQIGAAFAESVIIPEDAPSNGYNSGVDADGTVVSAENPGIGGDKTAIKITLPDGTVIWILGRCGNIVVIIPPLPPGPTDQCPWNPELPPGHPECLEPKKPNQSTAQNPDVPNWIKDAPGDKHTVNNNDGSKDSRGLQQDPQKDAQKASEEAKKDSDKREEEHKKAVDDATNNGGGVVDDNQNNGPSSSPPPGW